MNSLYRILNTALSSSTFISDVKLTIYPNPTTSTIKINLENDLENATIKIISIMGQVVLEKNNINGTDFIFDVSNLSSGVYVIKIADENASFNSKFIKNN